MNITFNPNRHPRIQRRVFDVLGVQKSFTDLVVENATTHERAVLVRLICRRNYMHALLLMTLPDGSKLMSTAITECFDYNGVSAAVELALENVGFRLSESIRGRGKEAVSEALSAVASRMFPDVVMWSFRSTFYEF